MGKMKYIFLICFIILVSCQSDKMFLEEQANQSLTSFTSKIIKLKYNIAQVMSGRDVSEKNTFTDEEIAYLKKVVFVEHYNTGDYSEYKILNPDTGEIEKNYYNHNGALLFRQKEKINQKRLWDPIILMAIDHIIKGYFSMDEERIAVVINDKEEIVVPRKNSSGGSFDKK